MTNTTKYITLKDKNFREEVIESAVPVLVDFWVAWRGSSQIMTPVIIELAAEFEGEVKVGRLNVDNNTRVPAAYGIRTIPTFLLFKDGQVVDQVVGMARKIELANKLYALLQKD